MWCVCVYVCVVCVCGVSVWCVCVVCGVCCVCVFSGLAVIISCCRLRSDGGSR